MMDPQEQAHQEAFIRLNDVIDQTHADMMAFQEMPHGPARRAHFLAFLKGVETIDQLAYDYHLAHYNRVRKEK